jgi:hypothetical protein
MITRSLWLLLSLILAFGVPFFAVGVQGGSCVNGVCETAPALGWPAAIIVSILGLMGAAWAVRQSRSDRDD